MGSRRRAPDDPLLGQFLEEGGPLLDVRLSGPPELVAEALAALRLVLEVADASRPYANRPARAGGCTSGPWG